LCFLVYLVDVRTEKLMKKIVSMCDAYVICITTAVFNVTYALLGRKHLLPEFWEELEKYSLQNLALWIFEERQRFRKGNAGQNSASLTLVGRDCDTLLDYMKQILSNLKQMFPSATEQLDILLELWKLWVDASYYLTVLKPTAEKVDNCAEVCNAFRTYFLRHGLEHSIWYIHVLDQHVPIYNYVMYKEFGMGYAALTTQGM
jgi:hypothetical protein